MCFKNISSAEIINGFMTTTTSTPITGYNFDYDRRSANATAMVAGHILTSNATAMVVGHILTSKARFCSCNQVTTGCCRSWAVRPTCTPDPNLLDSRNTDNQTTHRSWAVHHARVSWQQQWRGPSNSNRSYGELSQTFFYSSLHLRTK